MLAAMAAFAWIYEGGPADKIAELALSALAGGELIEADNNLLAFGATSSLVLTDRPEALDASNAQTADAYQRGSLFSMSGIHLWRGFLHLWRGELPEAEELLRTAFESHERWGYGNNAHTYTTAFFCSTMIARGDLEAARGGLTSREVETEPISDGARYWHESHVELLLAEGRFEETIEAADEIGRRFAHWSYPPASRWRPHKALALHALGRVDEARALAEEELGAGAGVRGARPASGARCGCWARSRAPTGSPICTRLSTCSTGRRAGSSTRGRWPPWARSCAGPGSPRRRTTTSRARSSSPRCAGPDRCPTLARAELLESGVEPSVEAPSGLRALTDTQRRVAVLAAEGRSEREIAQAMFVTPNAVDFQLGDVYRKLGVSSRDELALALGGG